MALIERKIADLTKIDFVKKSMTAKEVYDNYKPSAFINAALYDMTSSTNITKVEDENKSHGYLFSDNGIGITVDYRLCWTTFSEATRSNQIRDFIAGSPTLVVDGVIKLDWGNKVSTQIQGKKYRSAIGFNTDTLFMFSSDETMTLEDLAKYMKKIGCMWAINLDGGGSCHLQEGTTIYKNSTRKNASWFMMYENRTVLTIDSKTILIDGVPKEYDTAPFIKNNRTYIHVQFLKDMGYNVEWKANTRQVILTRKDKKS